MPRSPEENGRIRQLAKENIRVAAIEVFIEKGYHAASIDDVAKRAGISKGLLYNYFSGKADLLKELILSRIEEIVHVMEEAITKSTPVEQLVYIADHALLNVQQKPNIYRFYWHIQTHPEADEIVSTYCQLLKDEMARQFKLQVDIFRRMGEANPQLQSLHFSTALHGMMLMYSTYPENFPLLELKDEMLSRFFKYIGEES
ncbi:TetR/AcrR family transcriptional regulator [Brevibacillus choshinensis]|uniref:TetR/AcrR family transcriptional regulator n=1 Tax=Brevibacillus choshinensis TaxID=54911 RepID=UPI002E1F92AD|nr:TetR/AcrR family transcriptional regulator [Brevibacillus choshinensis]MED4782963.1 TetR/AcrR family transcriptional regulator [Brevibacillus choshinensis]